MDVDGRELLAWMTNGGRALALEEACGAIVASFVVMLEWEML